MNFWDERFASKDYVYGTKPNRYFKTMIDVLQPGTLLLPGEGEGRQACYAAGLGWKVTAFDSSKEGIQKAMNLAEQKGVSFDYQLSSYLDYQPKEEFDVIALLFTHMDPESRALAHNQYVKWLRPGGRIILQGFRKEQLGLASGGPKSLEMLFSKAELEDDFSDLTALTILEMEEVLDEGPFHQGMAKLITLTGIK